MGRAGAAKHSRPPRQTGSGCRCNRGGVRRGVSAEMRFGAVDWQCIKSQILRAGARQNPCSNAGGCGAGDARAACQSQSASKICRQRSNSRKRRCPKSARTNSVSYVGGRKGRRARIQKFCEWAQKPVFRGVWEQICVKNQILRVRRICLCVKNRFSVVDRVKIASQPTASEL